MEKHEFNILLSREIEIKKRLRELQKEKYIYIVDKHILENNIFKISDHSKQLAINFQSNKNEIQKILKQIVFELYDGSCNGDIAYFITNYYFKKKFFNEIVDNNDFNSLEWNMPETGSPKTWFYLVQVIEEFCEHSRYDFGIEKLNIAFNMLKKEHKLIVDSFEYKHKYFCSLVNSALDKSNSDYDDTCRITFSNPDYRFPMGYSLKIEQNKNRLIFDKVQKKVNNLVNDSEINLNLDSIISLLNSIDTKQVKLFNKSYQNPIKTMGQKYDYQEEHESNQTYHWFCDPFNNYLKINILKNNFIENLRKMKTRKTKKNV